jgi:hypothetical protein
MMASYPTVPYVDIARALAECSANARRHCTKPTVAAVVLRLPIITLELVRDPWY